jgi:branched-subunit amino acid transport protein
MSEAQKHHIQHRARRLPQSLENALGVLVQAILFALILAAFIVASEPSVMSIDSVQSLQHKKRVPLGVRTMPRR